MEISKEVTEAIHRGIKNCEIQKDDNPDCIPFYRFWNGLRELFGKEFVGEYHGIFHQATISLRSYAEPDLDVYFKETIRIFNYQHPIRHPAYRKINPDPKPELREEERARKIFESHFRVSFKGKRINSNFAKTKWESVKEQAYKFARENFEAEMKIWEKKQEFLDKKYYEEDKRDEEYRKKRNVFLSTMKKFGLWEDSI